MMTILESIAAAMTFGASVLGLAGWLGLLEWVRGVEGL